jgi:predicted AlkP superfamily pyrophosphatase or phosphodiesterase
MMAPGTRVIRCTVIAFAILGTAGSAAAQDQQPDVREQQSPRLVVVVVVDQLRGDYLTRFRQHFGAGGFNLLLDKGAYFAQARYEHGATKTCPGHATVLTGSHPATTGIIGNDWWDIETGRVEYCAHDAGSALVGGVGEGRSPRNLVGSTVGDVLRLGNDGRSRVITVAGKDRSAIMLGGHLAEAAYWTQDTMVITSAYYRSELPEWVDAFNASGRFTTHFGASWDRLLPADVYAARDDQTGERDVAGMGRTFPHLLGAGEARPGPRFVNALEYSPYHNDVVVDFAIEALRNERLGRGDSPDVLAVAFSANDRIGHAFGPASHEVMDAMVRADRQLERLFRAIDEHVGLGSTLIVLTSDHGVADLPETARQIRPGAAAARLHPDTIAARINVALTARFGDPGSSWVASAASPYVYLNRAALEACEVSIGDAATAAADVIAGVPGVRQVLTRAQLEAMRAAGARSPALLSYHAARSGDLMYETEPGIVPQSDRDGTTHGSSWSYDRHVPIAFYGAAIRPGTFHRSVSVADIAPTLSAILGILPPPAAEGRVLTEALR